MVVLDSSTASYIRFYNKNLFTLRVLGSSLGEIRYRKVKGQCSGEETNSNNQQLTFTYKKKFIHTSNPPTSNQRSIKSIEHREIKNIINDMKKKREIIN